VIRHLGEARANGEVRFRIEGPLADCVALEARLERALGVERAVVCPAPAGSDDPAQPIGFAAGMAVSDLLRDGVRLGVGWGRTLHHALATLSRPALRDASVVSLIGGVHRARAHNPSEFAWRVAAALGAECHLFTAPAIVDSPETRAALLERCGLDAVVEQARRLDMALVSVGSMEADSTALGHAREMMKADIRPALLEAGAVGDMFFNYFDAAGRLVDHPVNARVMSAPIACVRAAGVRLLASGGPGKAPAIVAACRMIAATMLVTDERTAAEVLALAGG
jgi:DNA-binding transcriptional regulator LsrR (DeoR family)